MEDRHLQGDTPPPEADDFGLVEIGLLDFFAASAMQSIFTGPGARHVADRDERYDETNWAHIVATNAYDMAEAMVVERRRRYSAVRNVGYLLANAPPDAPANDQEPPDYGTPRSA